MYQNYYALISKSLYIVSKVKTIHVNEYHNYYALISRSLYVVAKVIYNMWKCVSENYDLNSKTS